MQIWPSNREQWEWSKKNLAPAIMQAAERLGDLLEPELKGVSDSDKLGVLGGVLDAKLREAGINQLNRKQRKRALEILCQCWTVEYAAPLAIALEKRGELP